MVKDNSTGDYSDIKGVESFIIEALLKKGKVVIPDFGHLELKSLGDRRTVLFKPNNNDDSFLQIMSAVSEKEKKDADALYSVISLPLKEDKIVNLPQIGVFRPVKNENGDIRVSYIPSSFLRKLLNQEEETGKTEKEISTLSSTRETIVEAPKHEIIQDKITVEETGEKKSEKSEAETVVVETVKDADNVSTPIKPKFTSSASSASSIPPLRKKAAQVGDIIVPQDKTPERNSRRSKNYSGIFMFIIALIAIIVVIVLTVTARNSKKAEERVELVTQTESINLPALAEQRYGNSAFWIYIYEANADKLSSPINIPKDVSLVFPDLKTEYDVDVTDSLEIRRARVLADIVLKQAKNLKKITK